MLMHLMYMHKHHLYLLGRRTAKNGVRFTCGICRISEPDRVRSAVRLTRFPYTSVIVEEAAPPADVRDTAFGNYVVRYSVQDEALTILRIGHHYEDASFKDERCWGRALFCHKILGSGLVLPH
jgi:hypothetical protein